MSQGSAAPTATVGHSWFEDTFSILTGTLIVSVGVFLLHAAGAVTGGTVGLALLVSYASGAAFPVIYVVLSVPFLALAFWKRGAVFTIRTVISVLLLAGFSVLSGSVFHGVAINPFYGVFVGNVLCGAGMLILFRHNSSLGGLNTLAMLAQEYWGIRAGWAQMALDGTVVLLSIVIAPLWLVALSALGAVALNTVLVQNHRPGRYVGA